MDDWLRIPERPRGLPAWRLCLLMAISFLILWLGAPFVFAMVSAEI